MGIRSLVEETWPKPHQLIPVALPPIDSKSTLALKLFRGEPAIAKLDWNFSSIHKSSPELNDRGFGPPPDVTQSSPCS